MSISEVRTANAPLMQDGVSLVINNDGDIDLKYYKGGHRLAVIRVSNVSAIILETIANQGQNGELEGNLDQLARQFSARSPNPSQRLYKRLEDYKVDAIQRVDEGLDHRQYLTTPFTVRYVQKKIPPLEQAYSPPKQVFQRRDFSAEGALVGIRPGDHPFIERSQIVVAESDSEMEARFGQIFEQDKVPIYHHIYSMLRNPEDALDFMQLTFMKAYEAFAQNKYQENSQSKAWLYKIATNSCLDEIQRRQIIRWQSWESYMSVFDHRQVAKDNPELAVLEQERVEAYQKVLDGLKPKYKSVLALDEQGLSNDDIAQILHLTFGGTKALLARARRAFREEYKKQS